MSIPQLPRVPRARRRPALIGIAGLSYAGAVAASLTACGQGTDPVAPGATSANGTLSVAVTDAPFAFGEVAKVELYVVRIDGRVAASDSAEAERGKDSTTTNADPAKGWVTLATPGQRIDFLALQGGKTVNLGLKTLPTGTYQGFRLVLNTDSSRVTLKDGTVLTGSSKPGIQFPSAARSGIKINLAAPIAVVAGGTQMVVDFDLGRSFVMRGHTVAQNGLLFKPVVRATAEDRAGALAGTVVADSAAGARLADATVEVLKAGTAAGDTASANVVATTKSDSAGAWTAAFLTPGAYALRATKTVGTATKTGYVASATVTAGTKTSGLTVIAR